MGIWIDDPRAVMNFLSEPSPDKVWTLLFGFDSRPAQRNAAKYLMERFEWICEESRVARCVSVLLAKESLELRAAPRDVFAFLHMEVSWSNYDAALYQLWDKDRVRINATVPLFHSLGIDTTTLPSILAFNNRDPDRNRCCLIMAHWLLDTYHAESHLSDLFRVFRSSSSYEALVEFGAATPIRLENGWLQKVERQMSELHAEVESIDQPEFLPIEDRKKTKIFISYASEDRVSARSLAEDLRLIGFDVWIDVVKLIGGEDWDRAIKAALEQADFFLACLSKSSVSKRGYVQREFKRALDLWQEKLGSDIYILPLRLDDCEIPDALRSLHWIDYRCGGGLVDIVRSVTVGKRRDAQRGKGRPQTEISAITAPHGQP